MAELKHVGRLVGNGKKCVVAYRTLPGDAYNCLVVLTENLPDYYHDALINLVESNAGQTAYEFAECMARSNFPDGSIMLAALHTQNRLLKVSTDQVEMLPTTTAVIKLSELNQLIAEQRGTTVDELSLKSEIKQDQYQKETELVKDDESISDMTPDQLAKKYRSDADRLSKEAAQLRRLAEELVPTTKKSKAEVAEVEESKEVAVEEPTPIALKAKVETRSKSSAS